MLTEVKGMVEVEVMVATEVSMLRVHTEEMVVMVMICKVTDGGVPEATLIIVQL